MKRNSAPTARTGKGAAALIAAATVGDGIFALPYVFMKAGWFVSVAYLAALGGFVVLAHSVYLATLEKEYEKRRLLGLARMYFGEGGFWTGFVAIVAGLLLTLVAYLLLGTQFIVLAFPGAPSAAAFALLWALLAIPVFLDGRGARGLERAGIAVTSLAVAAIFAMALPAILTRGALFIAAPFADWRNFFLPFGPVLFTLAGWTGIESVYEARHEESPHAVGRTPWAALARGTAFAALLYVLFAAGVLGSVPVVAPDTASGLAAWPVWERELAAVMGLVAVATVYIPIAREIRNALEKDLAWNKWVARAGILLVPPALVGLGLTDFLAVVGIVGGVFLSVQYLLIVAVGRRALAPSPVKRFFLDLAAAVFVIAAVYEIVGFVVH